MQICIIIITGSLVSIAVSLLVQTYVIIDFVKWNVEQGIKHEISSDLQDKYIIKLMQRMDKGGVYNG